MERYWCGAPFKLAHLPVSTPEMRRRRSQGRVHPLMMMTAAPLSDVEAPLRLRGWPSPTYSLKARRQFLIGAAILTMFLLLIMHTNHAAAAVAMSSFIIPHHPSPSTATYRRGNVRRRACDGMLSYQWECRPCTPSMAAAQSSTSVSLTAATFNNHSNSNNNKEEEDGNDDGDDVLWTTTTTKMTGSDTSSSPIPPPILCHIPNHLVHTLDLRPLIERVASYAHTHRGREAILQLIDIPPSFTTGMMGSRGDRTQRRQQRQQKRRDRFYIVDGEQWKQDSATTRGEQTKMMEEGTPIICVASSAVMANMEYDLISQAMDVIRAASTMIAASAIPVEIRMPLPPMFGLYDGMPPSTWDSMDDTAYNNMGEDGEDESWVDLCLGPTIPGCEIYDIIDLRRVLQAEQVVKLLLDTREWAERDEVRWYVPGLAEVARMITEGDNDDDVIVVGDRHKNMNEEYVNGHLVDLHRVLGGAVDIVRGGGPNHHLSYEFRLASGTGKFPELDELRAKEERLMTKSTLKGHAGGGAGAGGDSGLAKVRNEISLLEDLIQRQLTSAMVKAVRYVQRGLHALARLDAIFARASYGCDWDGTIPTIGTDGQLHVKGFVHPVLSLRKEVVDGGGGGGGVIGATTPIDLLIPGGRGRGYQGLIISGPNGGGKTLALKSFGLVAMMAKLGIPITIAGSSMDDQRRPIVDYFDDILVEVGDTQSIGKQESTLMAKLNSLSTLIQKMSPTSSGVDAYANDASRLILLDELGGGTDPFAGGALSQSILEKLVSMSLDCRVIATTHTAQLKALSVNDDRFESASVLMNDKKYPTYQLSYGTTGESFALEAARRAQPSLPDDVIQRAAELMNGVDDGAAANSLDRYLLSLEQEHHRVREIVKKTEATYNEVHEYKTDMISKMHVSRMQLSRLECRLGSIFDTLRGGVAEDVSYELVGDSLDTLRLMKRKLLNEEERLSEKGLRRVTESYKFREGETVVIIADHSEWNGYDAVVQGGGDNNDPLNVTVVPVLDFFSLNENYAQEALVLQRRDVAIFDYPKWELSNDKSVGYSSERKSSRNNVIRVLSTLNTSAKKTSAATKVVEGSASFTSSRQRKAANAALNKERKAKK